MKSIFLCVVVIAALVVAGIGGTLAGFSDTEESKANYVTTGSLDLKVDGNDDKPYGVGVDTVVKVEDIMPSKWYSFSVNVQNMGQAVDELGYPENAHLYIHFKNLTCESVPPKHDGYDVGDGRGKNPEPELVAEYGGWIDQKYVEGLGVQGDNCTLKNYIDMQVWYGTLGKLVWEGKMKDAVCKQLYLGELPPCGATHTLTLKFHLPQINESHYGKDYFPAGSKFEYWPTNAYMLDKVKFDILFELLQEKVKD